MGRRMDRGIAVGSPPFSPAVTTRLLGAPPSMEPLRGMSNGVFRKLGVPGLVGQRRLGFHHQCGEVEGPASPEGKDLRSQYRTMNARYSAEWPTRDRVGASSGVRADGGNIGGMRTGRRTIFVEGSGSSIPELNGRMQSVAREGIRLETYLGESIAWYPGWARSLQPLQMHPAVKQGYKPPVLIWGNSSAGRALPLQGRGHGFDPRLLHQDKIGTVKVRKQAM